MTDLSFPPLMHGEPATDPLALAEMRAAQGVEAGLITYDLGPTTLRAALVFAPEVPLSEAMAMLPLCGVALQNALGSLAPPEVAVHLDWTGGLRVNGGRCGRLEVRASDTDPAAVPDWLVVGFTLPLWPPDIDRPGDTPDDTALYAEGCTEVSAPDLVEAWSRHTLNWLDKWEASGSRALHDVWRGLAWDIGKEITLLGRTGTFVGVDDRFGLLLRTGPDTTLIPLTALLEETP